MIFNNINDENGTPLSVFAKLLQEKAAKAGLTTVIVFAAQAGDNKGIHTLSTIATPIPYALIALGEAMLDDACEVTAEGNNGSETVH